MGDNSTPQQTKNLKAKVALRAQSLRTKNNLPPLNRQESIGAIEELLQCGVCLDKLSDSRMLPCQHTFCLSCLQSHLVAKKLVNRSQPPTVEQMQKVMSNESVALNCPVCQQKCMLEHGFDSLEGLPKNLYIESLLKVIDGNVSPGISKAPDYRCVKCQTVSQEDEEHVCQHCRQIFCKVCWNEHISELESNVTILKKQIEESKTRLTHKLDNFENCCDHLCENIKEAALDKIEAIKRNEEKVLLEVAVIKREGKVTHDNIIAQIKELTSKLSFKSLANDTRKVSTFMNLHRETSSLLNQVNHYGEARMIFDPETFRLDQDTEGIYKEVDENEAVNGIRITNPLESIESMVQYYKTRPFVPKLIWNKCPKPTHIGIPPWDNNLLYICASDTHTILIFNRQSTTLEGRLTSPEVICPQGIAFSKNLKEIYVSDKWKHCIHVFSATGDYLRNFLSKGYGIGKVRSPDGLAMGPNDELIISDTGNDEVIVVNPKTGEHVSTIGVVNGKTMLNMPTDVAVSGNKVIVADTGNHRIKTFNLKSGEKIHEFGLLGRGKGQFRSAEVVTVDPLGFILVGDAGNARIQVFTPDGSLVKVFGGEDIFGWLSGIIITDELDIITTDRRTRSLKIF